MCDYKIFQIGFNKCGTWSIHALFEGYAKIKSVHWQGGLIAKSIMDNMNSSADLLPGFGDVRVFTDMECCFLKNGLCEWFFAFKHFELLDKRYPGSKFILNTRNLDGWLKSRFNHPCGHAIDEDGQFISVNPKPYWERMASWMGRAIGRDLLEEEVKETWIREREDHHGRVMEYFKNRPGDLLVFDLDNDPFEKFRNFFPDIDFATDKMPILNNTLHK